MGWGMEDGRCGRGGKGWDEGGEWTYFMPRELPQVSQ